MNKLMALLLALSLQGCTTAQREAFANADWSRASQQTNQMLYGNPNGYQWSQPSAPAQPQRRVDLGCVQKLRQYHDNLALAHHQCSY